MSDHRKPEPAALPLVNGQQPRNLRDAVRLLQVGQHVTFATLRQAKSARCACLKVYGRSFECRGNTVRRTA